MAENVLKLYEDKHLTDKQKEFRAACENRFAAFVHGVAPWLILGHIHYDVCDWMQDNLERGNSHQLMLLPRAHLKSTLAYLWACWRIIKNPAITIIYASASHTLAEMQVSAIKNILAGNVVSYYWPGLLDPEPGKRKVWRQTEITVDHIFREEKGVRDYTIRAIAIGHNVTGSHCDTLIYDDVVAPEAEQHSPWTAEGRNKLKTWSSFMTSVLNSGGDATVVGTRYHAKDLYNDFIDAIVETTDDNGEVVDSRPLYVSMVKVVEENGEFLWARMRGPKGNWEGFNWDVLNKKKAGYVDKSKFHSQYYQNPIDPETSNYVKEFNYYDREKLQFIGANWYIVTNDHEKRLLNVYAAVDIASTTNKDSDYTAIVVLGVDYENNRYILDISRFKTDRGSVIVNDVFRLYEKWKWKRIKFEVVAAQRFVYTQVREAMRSKNIFFNVEEYKPRPSEGSKPERIKSVLEILYTNQQIFHYRGSNCQALEEELVLEHAPHDDIADALAMVNMMCHPPSIMAKSSDTKTSTIKFHNRFGGVTSING